MKTTYVNEQIKVGVEIEFMMLEGNIKCLYADWYGDFIPVEDVKKGACLMVQMARESGAVYIVNDNRKVAGVWDDANDWIVEEPLPQLRSFGVKKFAHIISPEFFAALSGNVMVERSNQIGFFMKVFKNWESAVRWFVPDKG